MLYLSLIQLIREGSDIIADSQSDLSFPCPHIVRAVDEREYMYLIIIFLISYQNHMLLPSSEPSQPICCYPSSELSL